MSSEWNNRVIGRMLGIDDIRGMTEEEFRKGWEELKALPNGHAGKMVGIRIWKRQARERGIALE